MFDYAIRLDREALKCQPKSSALDRPKLFVMRPVASKGRRGNNAYRVREHLTEAEMDKLLAGWALDA
jgi:hypothetical protein